MSFDINEVENTTITGENGTIRFVQLETTQSNFEEGPNKANLSLKTDKFRDTTKLNDIDKQIQQYFLFSKDAKENSVFLRNPETNIIWKIEQTAIGKLNDLWLESNLPHLVPNLINLIKSHIFYGDEYVTYSTDERHGKLLNAKILNEMHKELKAFFPIILRKQADRVGAYGKNYAAVDEKVKYEACEGGKIVLSANGKLINIYEALTDNIFALKDSSNTIDTSDIKPYSLSKDDYSFHKLNGIEMVKPESVSYITQWLRNRLTEDEIDVLKAWIYGVYDDNNKGRQILYLYDPHGHSGKSTFLNAVFEPLFRNDLVYAITKTDNSIGGRFDAYSYYDKRLLLWGDCKNANFIKTSTLHSLTGSDPMPIEPKGLRGFTYRPNIKIIIGSNLAPNIDTSALHEISRVIILKWKMNAKAKAEITTKDENGKAKTYSNGVEIVHGDAKLEERLRQSLPEFLYECKIAYDKLCKGGATVDVSSIAQNTMDIATDDESFYDEFFDSCFVKTDNASDFVSIDEIRQIWVKFIAVKKDEINSLGISAKINDVITHFTKQGMTKSKVRGLVAADSSKQKPVLRYMRLSDNTKNDSDISQHTKHAANDEIDYE